jgi:CubicO group peptidase (beta-lactamase class C family)
MRRFRLLLLALVGAIAWAATRANGGLPQIETGLRISLPGASGPQTLDLRQALRRLHVPSVSIALIGDDRIVWAGAYGNASVHTLYQAASMSKLVTAVAAMRLAQDGRLHLDDDVNTELRSWHLPASELTRGHPVTLRGLLSMTGGVAVQGYSGYEPGSPLPTLTQILNGAPPANSPPIRVERMPGTVYAYSGGGYEIVQALIGDATHQPFPLAMQDLVLQPLGMANSTFAQPLPPAFRRHAATGHLANGAELPGGWRVMPELAAAGLWSTPTDLAKLLIAISMAYKGKDNRLLEHSAAEEMLSPQNGGPYGLGAVVRGSGATLVVAKRGQNVGYQGYMLIFPASGDGIVVMTGSNNGTTLATAIIQRAAAAFGWPPLGELPD